MWEEPCISGEEGSGTVFFSGCPLKCVYCQNSPIAHQKTGRKITDDRLAEIFLELQDKGANNINLVTPTHYTISVINALDKARSHGLHLPVVYNCSGYEKAETIEMLRGYIDIYLTDFKYLDQNAAARYSNAPDYPEKARSALSQMFSQQPCAGFDERGMMKKGIIVRHLMLPGQINDTKNIIRYLYETYHDDIFISIMNQFTPMPGLDAYPELNRKITDREYDEVIDFAVDLGIENAFVQDGAAASESFIPCFDCEGI